MSESTHNMSIIDFLYLETRDLFSGLEEYLVKLEAQITTIQQNESEKLNTMARQEFIEPEEYFDDLNKLEWNYEYFFPRALRYSFIVLLFVGIEKQLTEFCKRLQKQRNLQIKSNDLKGDIIERSSTYIHKIAGLPDTLDWQKIKDLSVVRNCIAHTMGNVEDSRDKDRIYQMVSTKIGLSIDNEEFGDENYLQVSAEYCSRAVKNIQIFFHDLFDIKG